MKFDKMFPDARPEPPHDEHQFEGSTMVMLRSELPCWHCQTYTAWADLNFQAPLCSAECARAKWAEYAEAAKK